MTNHQIQAFVICNNGLFRYEQVNREMFRNLIEINDIDDVIESPYIRERTIKLISRAALRARILRRTHFVYTRAFSDALIEPLFFMREYTAFEAIPIHAIGFQINPDGGIFFQYELHAVMN